MSNYSSFADHIDSLTIDEYCFSNGQKWTAAQQLEHIVLCVKPLVMVFSMDKATIEQTFGRTDREGRTYEALLSDYFAKLNEGGKAPARFLPQETLIAERENLCKTLLHLIKTLCSKIETFSDEELDTLLVPHPLLGSLTLREMLYNAIYHVLHHRAQVDENLKKIVTA